MSAQTDNNSNSKFGGNIMFTVDNTLGLNQIQQMQSMNSNALQMDNANTALQNLSKAMGDLDTPNSGIGGDLLSVGVFAAFAVGGLVLSCLIGPEAEVAADAAAVAVDGAIEGAVVGTEALVEGSADAVVDAGADVVMDETIEGATELTDFAASGIEGGAESSVEAGTEVASESTEALSGSTEALSETVEEVTENSKSFTDKVKDAVVNGGSKVTKAAKRVSPLVAGVTIGGALMTAGMTIDGGVTSATSAKFTKQSNDLNSKSSQVQNVIGEINTRLSQNEQSIQGAQQVIQSTFQIASQIYNITPSAA